MSPRWSDEQLDEFHGEFQVFAVKFDKHIGDEAFEQQQQQELYAAVFQKEDKEKNIPPGLLQSVSRISEALSHLSAQKTFLSGMVAAVGVFWFIISGAGRTLFQWLSKL